MNVSNSHHTDGHFWLLVFLVGWGGGGNVLLEGGLEGAIILDICHWNHFGRHSFRRSACP